MGDFDTKLTEIHFGGASDAVVDSLISLPKRPQSSEPVAFGNCGTCGLPVGFYPPEINAEVCPWHCQCCNAIHFAKAAPAHDKNYFGIAPLPPFADLVAPEAPRLSEVEDATPPDHLLRLVKLLCNQDYRGVERRRYQRYAAVVSVIAVPLNDEFRVSGLPLRMTTTNVSHSGISLIYNDYHVSAHYALDFSVSAMPLCQAVVTPVRMRALGPVYEIGARFVRGLVRQVD